MAAPSGTVTIGEISYLPNEFLGYGSHLTIVFKGKFGRRNVAVKKIPTYFANIAEKEKDLLLCIDVHPNIVRYYHMEKDHDGCYLALLLCDYTLAEYVTTEKDNLNLTPIILLKEITLGLQFLHDSKIIHHDLKPLNILISYPNHVNERKAMISDFGISKETLGTRDSVTLTSRRGTDGFVAPEVYAKDTVTNAIDVFALGCIYFYTFSKGEQIFQSMRDVVNDRMYKICIETYLEKEHNDYCSLVLRMIDRDATKRPSCEQILFHHIYWAHEKKMQFLQVTSDFMERNERERLAIDAKSAEISGNSWFHQMSDNLIADLVNGKRNQGRKGAKDIVQENTRNIVKKYYDGTKTSSLLRAIRNICNHYDDIIILAKGEIQSIEGFVHHCFKQFPKLFSKIYDMAEEWSKHESIAKFYIQRTSNVGEIMFQLEPKIKITRNGSTLYKGQYKDRKVAVKVFNADLAPLGKNQWKLLESVRHKNIVRLFYKEEKENCLYIATTLGQYNLFEYVENFWNNDDPVPVQVLRHITHGLAFLHSRKIVHCDLTPANILISYPNQPKGRIAMITDFESSISTECPASINGLKAKKLSLEWMAPELQNSPKSNFTEASDTYSLGCIYVYVLSNGTKIFGKDLVATDRTTHNQRITETVNTAGLECYSGLLHHMLKYSPHLRPTSSKILQYPIFWELQRKVAFIKDVIELITINARAENRLLSAYGEICDEEWLSQVSQLLASDLVRTHPNKQENSNVHEEIEEKFDENMLEMTKHRYGGNKLSSIIHTMIEIELNYEEIIKKSKTLMATTPGGYIGYFIQCFPKIPDFVYNVMREFKDQPSLVIYYESKRQLSQGKSANSNWGNLDQRILRSILSKMPNKFYQKCHLISKSWQENERIFYIDWMRKNCANWTDSSFRNAMKSNVSCKDIYWSSGDKWKIKSTPTLLKTMDTGDYVRHICFSNQGKLIAMCNRKSIKIYDSKDFSTRFSRDLKDRSYSLYFNRSDTHMVLQSSNDMKVISIEEGLPILYSISCNISIRSPWLQDNIFLSGKREKEKTTFSLNEVGETGNADGTNKCQIFRVKGTAKSGTILTAPDSRKILFYISGVTKLGFTTFAENGNEAFPKQVDDGKIEAPDHEIDCKGTIIDYALVPDGNTMKVHAFTEVQQKDYCFFVIDLVNFELKSSILLIPKHYSFYTNLDSNEKYVISGSESKCVYVWNLKNGVCMTQLSNEDNCVRCTINPKDHQLVITAGRLDMKIKLWRLNIDKSHVISP